MGKAVVSRTWCWRRWIKAGEQETWIARLQAAGCLTWTFTERPNRVRILLAVYQRERAGAVALQRLFGGKVRAIEDSAWIPRPTPPTRIGHRLEIVHEEKKQSTKAGDISRLHVPHGIAFGSGEHGTTYMLLRALAKREDWNKTTVLDLGTGSGVLALATRLFGARKIVATDFDADAVRTARQNEALNFSKPTIRWQCADVKKLRTTTQYDLVLANLFSGILCEAAKAIAGCVAPGGELWLSGVLKSQQAEVVAAYRKQGLRLIEAQGRGKWVMLRWSARV